MLNLTVDSTAAFIVYEGSWSSINDIEGAALRMSNHPGDTATLNFRGSAFYVYGNYPLRSPQSESQ
ncbi:hypothetical protein FRC11_012507, partial [Ceratobasidium sp. 423]